MENKSGIYTIFDKMLLEKANDMIEELTQRFPEVASKMTYEQLEAMALMILMREEELR